MYYCLVRIEPIIILFNYFHATIFQVLGFDVLIDSKLRPHLLEVNAHPSLRVDFEQPVKAGVVEYVPSPVDMAIKLPVVKESLQVIGAKVKRY